MAGALSTIPKHFTDEYSANWEALVQQNKERLKRYVTVETFSGKRKRFNRIGKSEDPKEITERAGQTTHTDIITDLRWLYCKGYDDAKLFDEWDDEFLGTIKEPNSEVMVEMMKAFARRCDAKIIDAVRGDAYTGEEGTTAVSFDSGQNIAVDYVKPGASAANKNLTLAKLIKIASMFGDNEVIGQDVDSMFGDTIVLALCQSQLDSLLHTTETTSSDYAAVKALHEGKISGFMGIEFVRMPSTGVSALPKASNVRECLAWVRSGIKFREGEHRVDIDRLPERSHATQVRKRCLYGGVRMEEEKALKVFCDETESGS